MYFTADYLEQAVLDDGTPVTLRMTRATDTAILRRGFENWSPESRYARFLVPKARLSEEELRYLCDVDQVNHVAIGAIEQVDGAAEPVGLGIARFIRLPGSTTAEAAIAIADEVRGKGLGRLLFERLAAAGAERGVERFRCDLLGSNASMKALIEQLAAERSIAIDGGVMSIDFPLAGENFTPRS